MDDRTLHQLQISMKYIDTSGDEPKERTTSRTLDIDGAATNAALAAFADGLVELTKNTTNKFTRITRLDITNARG